MIVITIFAFLGGLAQIIFLANFFISMYRGQKATQNPWKSNTLEWTTPVEHIHGNWPGAIPEVHRWAYDYSKTGDENDSIVNMYMDKICITNNTIIRRRRTILKIY